MTAIIAFAAHRIKTAKTKEKAEDAAKVGDTNIKAATNGDPKGISKSVVTSENSTRPIIERNISIRQSLMNEIYQKETATIDQIEKNQATIDKLTVYLENHKRDNMDAEVTDPELVEEYPTLREAIDGLQDLKDSNAEKIEELYTRTLWGNREKVGTASDLNKISEDVDSDPNRINLIEE